MFVALLYRVASGWMYCQYAAIGALSIENDMLRSTAGNLIKLTVVPII